MIVPAALYLLMQTGQPGQHGWGTVMATDTAFVIGCLALLGSRIPRSLRVFMLSLAIIDDIGTILVWRPTGGTISNASIIKSPYARQISRWNSASLSEHSVRLMNEAPEITEHSPIFSGQRQSRTADEAVSRFLLTGVGDSPVIASMAPKFAKVRREGKSELVKAFLRIVWGQIADLNVVGDEAGLEVQLTCLDVSIEAAPRKRSTMLKSPFYYRFVCKNWQRS